MFILKPAAVRFRNGQSARCKVQTGIRMMWSQDWSQAGTILTRITREQQRSNSRGQTLALDLE